MKDNLSNNLSVMYDVGKTYKVEKYFKISIVEPW